MPAMVEKKLRKVWNEARQRYEYVLTDSPHISPR